ncbi:MAG: HEAT repeat domain-containing protein [Planctomycetota bacterium]
MALLTLLTATLAGCAGRSGVPIIGWALDGFGDPPLVEASEKAFDLYDPDRRRQGIQELADSPFGAEEAYLIAYRVALGPPPEPASQDPAVRAAALRALGRHGVEADATIAVHFLEDGSEFARWEAARALEHLPGAAPGEVRALRDVLIDIEQPSDVRQAVARALGKHRNTLAFDTLATTLADSDFAVVEAARGSLVTLTGQDGLGIEPSAWVEWAGTRRAELFRDARPYTPLPYPKPPTLWERLGPGESDSPAADTAAEPAE